MKKLDLNIKLREEVMDEDKKTPVLPVDLAKRWIGIMLERAINKPDPHTGRATINSGMEVQRQYYKVMNALDEAKDGIVEMDDELFNFIDRKFHQAEVPVQSGVAEILVKVDDAINLAKIPPKEGEKK